MAAICNYLILFKWNDPNNLHQVLKPLLIEQAGAELGQAQLKLELTLVNWYLKVPWNWNQTSLAAKGALIHCLQNQEFPQERSKMADSVQV